MFVKSSGVDGFGVYTLFSTIIILASLFAVPGSDINLIKITSNAGDQTSVDKALCNALKISGYITLALTFSAIFVDYFGNYAIPIAILIALSIFTTAQKYTDSINSGLGKSHRASITLLIKNILRGSTFLLMYGLFDLVTSIILTLIIEGCINTAYQFKKLNITNVQIAKFFDRKLDASGSIDWHVFGNSVIDGLHPHIDKFIISGLLGYYLLGEYKVVEALCVVISFAVTPFVFLWPKFARYSLTNSLDIQRTYREAITFIALGFCIISIFIINFYDLYLKIFSVENKIDIILLIFILSLSYGIDALSGPAGALLKLANCAKPALIVNLITTSIYLTLLPVLVSVYGVLGAAISKLVLNILANLLNIYYLNKFLKIKSHGVRQLFLIIFVICLLLLSLACRTYYNSFVECLMLSLIELLPVAYLGIKYGKVYKL